MSANEFKDYIIKVLNVEETKILKQCLIKDGYPENIILPIKNFQMLYMPNMEITTENLQLRKNIYFLVDDYVTKYYIQRKFSLNTFVTKNFCLIRMSRHMLHNLYTCHCYEYKINSGNLLNCAAECIYNKIKDRHSDIFMLMNFMFITDIAKYLFLIYYEVAFG